LHETKQKVAILEKEVTSLKEKYEEALTSKKTEVQLA